MLHWPSASKKLSEQDKISVQIYGKLLVLGVEIWFGEFKGREYTRDNLATVRRENKGGGRKKIS